MEAFLPATTFGLLGFTTSSDESESSDSTTYLETFLAGTGTAFFPFTTTGFTSSSEESDDETYFFVTFLALGFSSSDEESDTTYFETFLVTTGATTFTYFFTTTGLATSSSDDDSGTTTFLATTADFLGLTSTSDSLLESVSAFLTGAFLVGTTATAFLALGGATGVSSEESSDDSTLVSTFFAAFY